jgi:hypothetical protein
VIQVHRSARRWLVDIHAREGTMSTLKVGRFVLALAALATAILNACTLFGVCDITTNQESAVTLCLLAAGGVYVTARGGIWPPPDDPELPGPAA